MSGTEPLECYYFDRSWSFIPEEPPPLVHGFWGGERWSAIATDEEHPEEEGWVKVSEGHWKQYSDTHFPPEHFETLSHQLISREHVSLEYWVIRNRESGTLYVRRYRSLRNSASLEDGRFIPSDDSETREMDTIFRVDDFDSILLLVCTDASDLFEREMGRYLGIFEPDPNTLHVSREELIDTFVETMREGRLQEFHPEMPEGFYASLSDAIGDYDERHGDEA